MILHSFQILMFGKKPAFHGPWGLLLLIGEQPHFTLCAPQRGGNGRTGMGHADLERGKIDRKRGSPIEL
jgi:hypothetical protein